MDASFECRLQQDGCPRLGVDRRNLFVVDASLFSRRQRSIHL